MNKSLPKIIGKNPKILILGTAPGKQSLDKQHYYANPRNLFWWLMFYIFDKPMSFDKNTQEQLLIDNNIALWDMCCTFYRENSLDKNIKSESFNEIDTILKKYKTIDLIIFTSKDTEKKFNNAGIQTNIEKHTLASPSPSNSHFTKESVEEWKTIIKDAILEI